jgi:protein TonB
VSERLPQPKVEAEELVEIHNPPPAYPAAARRRGQEGHALVEVKILKDGSVAEPVVLECVGSPLFADAALKAVAAWRFQPTALGPRVHHVRFTFKMQT